MLARPPLTPINSPEPYAAKPARSRAVFVRLGKIALAAGLLAWLCTDRLDVSRLAAISPSPSLGLLTAMLAAAMVLPALRWWWLLRVQKIDASPWEAITLTWTGYVAALVLPGAVSGDLAKSYLIVRRCPRRRARSVSTVLVDRLIGVYSLLLLGAIAAAVSLADGSLAGPGQALAWTVVALFAGTTVTATVLLAGPWGTLAARFASPGWGRALADSHRTYRRSWRALIGCLALSLASSVLTALAFAAAGRVLHAPVSLSSSLLVGPLVVLANSLPITPGGMGVAEATASELFRQQGTVHGAELMLLIRVLMALLSAPALLTLLGRGERSISSSPIGQQLSGESQRADTAAVDRPAAA